MRPTTHRRSPAPSPLAKREGRFEGVRRAFSLVELLVVTSIILLLMGLISAALAAARGSQKKQATQALIGKLNAIITQQFESYVTREVSIPDPLPSGMTRGSYRSWAIRRNLITGDLPDRWVDVKFMADNAGQFTSPQQRAYIAVWNSYAPERRNPDSDQFVGKQYGGAECLFMIIMRGGIADCLDCNDLATSAIGDKDGDGAFEFHDAWGNPIEFLLWPSAVELPAGEGVRFFSGERALQVAFPTTGPAPSPSLGMKPLIYSAGPDGGYGLEPAPTTPPDASNLAAASNLRAGTSPIGRDCGNWALAPTSLYGGLAAGPDARSDNITNLDAEAKR